jgi:hypothetical protein
MLTVSATFWARRRALACARLFSPENNISLSLACFPIDPGAEAFSYQNIGNAPFSDKDNALSLRHVSHIYTSDKRHVTFRGILFDLRFPGNGGGSRILNEIAQSLYKLFVILDVTERGVCLSYRKDKDFASGAQCKQVNSFQRRDWNTINGCLSCTLIFHKTQG